MLAKQEQQQQEEQAAAAAAAEVVLIRRPAIPQSRGNRRLRRWPSLRAKSEGLPYAYPSLFTVRIAAGSVYCFGRDWPVSPASLVIWLG